MGNIKAKYTRKFVALLLASIMLLSCAPLNALAAGPSYRLMLNDAYTGDTDHPVTVAYGEDMELTLEDYTDKLPENALLWLSATTPLDDDAVWNVWSDTQKPTEPGGYYLGYSFEVAGEAQSLTDGSCRFTITKATPAAPTQLTWTGGTASWNAVTQNTNGKPLPDDAVTGYTVTLYRDGEAVNGTYTTTTATDYDFTSVITAQGKGRYTFAVQATTAETEHYETSVISAQSGAEIAAEVTVTAGAGIGSVTPANVLLLAGGEGANITAAAANGFAFSFWSGSGVSFGAAASSETTVTLPAGYTGGTDIAITANTADNTAPVIESFAAGTDSDYGKLTGKASDDGSGVASYAFSTATEANTVADADWKEAPAADETGIVTASETVAAAGTYYFYVKDASGNITKSGNTVQASEVDYSGYYDNGTAVNDKKGFLVGDTALTLATPSRRGYSFGGWFSSADGSGNAVTEITAHSDTAVTVYAKWTRNEFSIATQPESYSGVYDGVSHTLSVDPGVVVGIKTYQWKKDGADVAGATDRTWAVKNVADSGTYTVVVTVTLDGAAQTATSGPATVAITRKPLALAAENKSVTYGDAVPEYTYTADSFAGGEDKSVLTGTIACAYTAGDAAGTYDITMTGFAADNYEVSTTNGTLTVSAKGADITASLENDTFTYTYTGEEIRPAVTVKDGNTTLAEGKDYTLTYTKNVNVGKGTVTVTLKGNYSGTKELPFTISKATATAAVILAGWTYGETAGTPKLDTNPSGGEVTYCYYSASAVPGTAATTQPTAAGDYKVYAEIAATDNYEAVTTEPTAFTIAKRSVTLTAGSGTWLYDGNSHSNATYKTEGTFATGEGLRSVTVTGSITNVGTQTNTIAYILNSSTNIANYSLTAVNGTLTVAARGLTVPTDCAWDSSAPGKATWVAVTRDQLEVSYSVELYRVADGNYSLLTTETTTGNSCDFAAAIREDSKNNSVAGYSFKVKVTPSSGTNQGNYSESGFSAYASSIYTASVSVTMTAGIQSAAIGGGQSVILIQGESAALTATVQTGYTFSNPVWSETSGSVAFADAKSASTTLTLKALTAAQNISVAASCGDDLPVISAFSAEADGTHSSVTFTFSASDTTGITGWAVTTSGTDAPTAAEWHTIEAAQKTLSDQPFTVTAPGTYYVWVTDGVNTVCSASNESGATSIDIYKINFDGNTGTGSMASILKVGNTDLTLPQNTFTNDGYSFKNWKGATGIYTDSGSYTANAGDTLTAQWTDQQYSYTVNYYLMGTDGQYGTTPSSAASYSGAYGAVIEPSAPAQAGFALDTDKSNAITLTKSGLVLNVYYRRLQYTITYSYTEPGKTATTNKYTYYYCAAVTEPQKPSLDGYSFVGWTYSGSGTAPSTMPANDLTATGSFAANDAVYVINCYMQNVDGSENYTLAGSLGSTVAAKQGDSVTKATANAVAIEGFTASYVTASSGAPGGSTPAGTGASATGTVSTSSQLNINYYYTRNSYNLTLNVYDSNLRTHAFYTYTETRLYGANIDAAAFAVYGQTDGNWSGAPAGTVLAAYADWSTGTAPSVMPAGDVSVARDYITASEVPYKVEVYYETATAGEYALKSTLNYYANAETAVTIGGDSTYTINYTEFGSAVSEFKFYTYSADNTNNVTTATVAADGTTLKVYFERKTVTATITYYYNDGTTGTNVAFATVTKTGKWGTNYTYQPLALFAGNVPTTWEDNGAYKVTGTSNMAGYDFKTNGYIVSYSARYWDSSDGYHWPSHEYEAAADLTSATYADPSGVFGKSDNVETDGAYKNYVNVYYVKTEPQTHYYVDMCYNAKYNNNGLSKGVNENVPLTVSYNNATYKVRVVNKADVFKSTWTPSASAADIAAYPGLKYYSGSYTYDANGTLQTGFSAVTINSYTYYLNLAVSDYIYVIDDHNQFYKGSRVSYNYLDKTNFNTGNLGYDSAVNYLTDYQTAHGVSTDTANYDAKYKAAYIYNGGFSPIMYGNGTYVFPLYYHDTYSVSYTMNGNTHTDTGYVSGESVTPACNDTGVFPAKTGYTIVWYTDTSFTTRASAFNITGNKIFYGRYERSTIYYTITSYYELPDTGEYVTGTTGLEAKTSTEKISFTDGGGVTAETYVTVTKYYRGDTLVMAVREVPCLAFSEVSLDYTLYTEGLVYDDANSGNVITGYCEDTGIGLVSHYYRPNYFLTVNEKNTDVETETKTIYRFGQTVTLEKPEKDGYTFAGWTLEKWNGSAWEEWTDAPAAGSNGSVSFAMPQCNARATAKWTATNYASSIVHYFQTTGGTYDTALYAQLAAQLAAATWESASITYNNKDYIGRLYKEGDTVLGASIVVDDNTWYFSAVTADGAAYTADAADLIAVSAPITNVSETVLTVSDLKLSITGLPFAFAYAMETTGTAVTKLTGVDSFSYVPTSSVAYYYTRNGGYTVTLTAKASDGGADGLTISGGGTYVYGETVNLRASTTAGYTFKGWYPASDTGFQNALSTSAAYSFRVTEGLELTAVSEPTPAAQPTVALSGTQSYSYGYAASGSNTITTAVDFGGSTDSANKVSAYQWYSVDGGKRTPIESATSATYLFPAGKACGTYSYCCDVVITRTDNGRTCTVQSGTIEITVAPAGMTVEAAGYTGTYDGAGHGISVTVKKPSSGCVVYYSDTELTKANYSDAATASPTYKDVKITNGAVDSYKVYYYVHDTTGSYEDFSGSALVTINPITVTLKASGTRYFKTYDGSENVSGSVITEGTDKYKLSRGTSFTIIGLLSGDSDLYIADFDAAFNSRDVAAASAVTLSNIKIVSRETGSTNANYSFSGSYSVTLSGYIKPFVLNVAWGDTSFVYNGAEQKPALSLTTENPPEAAVKDALVVQGGQTNTGTYTAYASLTAGEDYDTGNYSFSQTSCGYSITSRPVTITPVVPAGSTYDGTLHTVTAFNISDDGLVSGQTYTAQTDRGASNAGTTVIKPQNMHIFQGATDVTDNYEIAYQSADYVIAKKTVTVSGFTAEDKAYDGTTAATVSAGDVIFAGIVAGDELSIADTAISGTFDSAAVGTGKNVNITLEASDLGGASKDNYFLDVTGSTLTTTASITSSTITVTGEDKTVVYGENVTFTAKYSGLKNNEAESIISGSVGYKIRATGTAGEATAYTSATPAGTYDIILDTSALSVAEGYGYSFAAAEAPATLTVTPRPLTVAASANPSVTKVYDGTTTATIATDDYTFAAASGETGLVNGDTVTLIKYTAVYNSKDVADAKAVTVSGMTLSNANYKLANDTFDIAASITKKDLTVTADDKTITYGDAAPAYTAKVSGFAGNEGTADLGGTPAFACDYNINDTANRGAKTYDITPSGYTSGNYNITFVKGTLTVSKAVITVTASPASLTYGLGSSVPAYTSAYSGFKYTDDANVISGTLTTTCSRTYADTPGEYAGAITPVITGLTADNYTFKAVAAKLTIVKHEIRVTGITVNSKTYDGTTTVSAAQIKTADAVYDGILAGDVSNKGVTVTGAYDSKNVGTGIRVGLTVGLNSYLAARYILSADTQSETTAAITQAPLTVTVGSKTIKYGDPEPTYSVTYSGFVNNETSSVLTGALVYSETYGTNSPVGSYTVKASGYDTNGNYKISYVDGTLTVAPAKLAAPTVTWNGTSHGTVKWTRPADIGAVTVSGYTVELLKDGAIVETISVTSPDELSHDFLETMRTNGAGKYTVQVSALASETNNAGKTNVADSAAGVVSAAKYAAKVTVQFAGDAVSETGTAITIHDNTLTSYVMIAGESGAAISATLKNATGYSVKSLTSSSTALTFGTTTKTDANVSSTASLSESLNSSADITATLTLSATPATLTVTVTGNPTTAAYGYTGDAVPKLTATAAVANDNVTADDYTYSYYWELKDSPSSPFAAMAGGNAQTVVFPTGKHAATNIYKVRCTVTATRNDNSAVKTVSDIFVVNITPAEFRSVVSLADWTYGAARNAPSVSQNPGSGTVAYEYSTSNDSAAVWTATIPKDAGSYYVRAAIAKTTDYQAFQTDPVRFTIAKAKLAAPDGLTMAASATAPYGQVSWNAVTGPQENAGTSADSTVSVKYEVKLYRAVTDSATDSDWALVYTSAAVTATSLDLTQQFTQAGFYRFTVKALATCSNGEVNCDDSDESARGGVIEIKSTMGSGDTTYEYKKVYNGEPIVLDASDSLAGVTYQWLRDKAEISGATDKTLNVTFVGETGTYTCRLTVGSDSYYSSNHVVTITPLPVTVTSETQTKVYDGTPLEGVTKSVTTLGTGDTIAYTLASRTNVGTSTNTITGVTITHNGTTTVFAEGGTDDNYTLTKTAGTLTVTARSLSNGAAYNTGIAVSQPDAVTYDGTAHTPAVTVTDSTIQVNGADKVLVLNTDYTVAYSDNKDAGTAVVTITGKGNYSGTITRSFTVNKREVTLTSASQTREYNGAALTNSTVTVTTGSFASGEGAAYTVTGSQLDVGESDNTFTYKLNSGTDADNYAIATVAGKLTVTKNTSPVVVTADSGSKTYDGTALTKNSFAHTGTIASIDKLTAVITGTRTDAGESTNVVTSYKVIRTSDSRDVTAYYTFGDSVSGKLTVNKRPVTLTSATQTREYNGTALTNGTVTVTGDGFVTGEGATCTVTGSQLDAGESDNTFTYKLNSGTAAENYTITAVEGKLTVSRVSASITVTANSNHKTYDGTALTDSGFSYTPSVLVAGDTLTAVITGSQTGFGHSNNVVKSYQIMRGTIDVTENYTFGDSVSGTLTVNKRPVTLTSGSFEKTYDGAALTDTSANPIAVTGEGFVTGEGATYTVTGKQLDAGTSNNTFNYTLNEGTKAENYTITKTEGTLKVSPIAAEIVITADSDNKIYDGTPLTDDSFTYTDNVLVSGDILTAVIKGTQTNAGESANTVASYKVTRTSDNKDVTGNYTFAASVDGKLTVSKRNVTMVSADLTKAYDGTALTNGGTALSTNSGWVDGQGVTVTFTGSQLDVGQSANAFTYSAQDGTDLNNYTVAETTGTLTVTKNTSEIIVTASDASRKYDGAPLTAGYTYTSGVLAPGDVLTAVITGSQTDAGSSKNIVTSYKVTRGTTDVTGNYTFGESVNGTLTVLKRDVTLTSATDGKTYDGTALTNNNVTVTGDGFAAGEGAICTVTGSRTYKGASDNTFTYTPLNSKTKVINYNITQVAGTLTISAVTTQIVITADSDSKTYDGTALTDSGFSYTPNVLVAGDTLTAVITGSQTGFGHSNNVVKSYQIMRGTIDVTENYTFGDSVSGTLTVNKRPVTLTSATDSKTYDGEALTNHEVTVGGEGFVTGEGAICTVTGSQLDAGESDNTFTYKLNSGTAAENYTITAVEGKLTVSRVSAPITVTANSNHKTYDGTALTDSGYSCTPNVLVAGDVLTAVITGRQTDAGSSENAVTSYKVTRTSDSKDVTGNYTFGASMPGTLTIYRRPVTMASADLTKIYDGTALTNGGTALSINTGWVGSQGVTVSFTGSQTYAGESANTFTCEAQNGTDLNNYNITEIPGKLTVARKSVTAVWTSTTAVYTGKPQSASVSLPTGSAVGSEDLGVSVTNATDAGSYILTATLTGADKANYTLTNPTGSFLIQRAPVTFAVTANSAEYNGSVKTAVVSAASELGVFSAYKITYKNSKDETVSPTDAGTYDIYAELTDPNFRHAGAANGAELKIGVLTIYAKAASAPTLYTVSFAGGDGANGSVGALAGAQAETVRVLPVNGFSKDGYSFTGWLYNGGVYQPGARFTQPAANVTLTAQWTQNRYNVGGVVNESNAPIANAVVTLTLGSNLIAQTTTNAQGQYSFTGVLPGTYNLAASYDGIVETIKQVIESSSVTDANITLPAGKTNSVVEVKAGTPDIVVGNLEQTFKQPASDNVYSDTDKGTVAAGGSVEIKLTAAENPKGSDEIETEVTKDNASAVVGIYIDLDLSKTVTTVTTTGGTTTSTTGEPITLSESNVLLETIIPLKGDLQGKSSYSVYRQHTDPDTKLTSVTSIPQGESNKNSDGEYFTVNEAKTVITVYAKKYSTYAIAYTQASPFAGGSINSITVSGADGGSAAADQASAAAGSKVTVTVTAAEGYRLDSIKAADAGGSAVALTENADGSYSFTMPGSAVTVTPVFVKKPWAPGKTGVSDLLKTADHIRYINGYPDGSVGPGRNMTRAEAAQMFYNLLISKNTAASGAFADVPNGLWCAAAVNTLSALGIIDGYGDGRFGPNDPITREQFCAMAVRFTNAASPEYGGGFPDVTAKQWSYRSVMTAAAMGWIEGFPDGTFRPYALITRAEVVTIVNRMLGRSADRTYVNTHADGLQTFSDLTDSGKWYYYDMTEAANAHGYAVTSGGNETWTNVAK